MIVIRSIHELRNYLSQQRNQHNLTVGLVPTMGYLHEGHVSLIKRAKETCQMVVLSIFVNPIQFGPNEDFDKYPRDEVRDLQTADNAGVDVVFMPTVEEMYPTPSKTRVTVSELTTRLCGASRPGHFDGVTTVVSKLFHIVQPDQAFFGLKDAQQAAVIEQMVMDLNMPVQIVPCPILREPDGLALSSRNVYLNEDERKQALVLSQSLTAAKQLIANGQAVRADELAAYLRQHIQQSPLAQIDYVEILSYPRLEPINKLQIIDDGQIIIALAVKFGNTRLIDNIIISMGGNLSCSEQL
jgi:pantoate--beta-alanine ligase